MKSAPVDGYVVPQQPQAEPAEDAADQAAPVAELPEQQVHIANGEYVAEYPSLEDFFAWGAQKQYHCLYGIVRGFYIHAILNNGEEMAEAGRDQIAAKVVF